MRSAPSLCIPVPSADKAAEGREALIESREKARIRGMVLLERQGQRGGEEGFFSIGRAARRTCVRRTRWHRS